MTRGGAGRLRRIFAALSRTGVKRHSLYLAWDFTVASEHGSDRADAAHPRRRLRRPRPPRPPRHVTPVTDFTRSRTRIARQVAAPSQRADAYLTGDGGPGSRLHYGPAGGDGPRRHGRTPLPTPSGDDVGADFVCNIPRSASAARPAHLSLYGHGLLGAPTEINSGNVSTMSTTTTSCSARPSWIGLAAADVPVRADALPTYEFPTGPDRLQQSLLNFLFLGRAMTTRVVSRPTRPSGTSRAEPARPRRRTALRRQQPGRHHRAARSPRLART